MVRSVALGCFASSFVALAACGGTVVFDEVEEGSGGSGDGGAPTTGPTTNASSSTGPTTNGTGTSGPGPSSSVTVSSGESVATNVSAVVGTPTVGICGSGVTLFFGDYDACLGESCCSAFEECTRDGADILGCQNCLDGFGGECSAALACAEGCLPSGGTCDSGLEPQLGPGGECLSATCCAEMMFCTSNGPRLDDCLECLQVGAGPRCDAFLACYEQSCNDVDGICGTGITTQDPEADGCLTANCCEELQACAGDDPRACIDCIDKGGGPLCDAALQCNDAFDCLDLG